MTAAIERLEKEGYLFIDRPTEYQLKIGRLSYYPSSRCANLDGEKGKRGVSLDQLVGMLRRGLHDEAEG